MDSSDSIDINKWNKLTSFAERVVNVFKPSRTGNHIGLISYGEKADVDFNFNVLQSEDAVIRYIDNVQYQPRGSRRIDTALNVASRDLFSQKGGYRPDARQVHIFTVNYTCLAGFCTPALNGSYPY